MAIVAKALAKPFYVLTESFKFVRLFPLTQTDLPGSSEDTAQMYYRNEDDEGKCLISNPDADYTPPAYITLIFTDVGVLTPLGVSEQLVMI